ncbi:unnamed protein product [Linum trigynum]|uniref:Ubiquitin-like domain-containing protein n=1 Tax=Linum trigynum TaxID=586398 RepID=A0AAV2GRF9_9ROSI
MAAPPGRIAVAAELQVKLVGGHFAPCFLLPATATILDVKLLFHNTYGISLSRLSVSLLTRPGVGLTDDSVLLHLIVHAGNNLRFASPHTHIVFHLAVAPRAGPIAVTVTQSEELPPPHMAGYFRRMRPAEIQCPSESITCWELMQLVGRAWGLHTHEFRLYYAGMELTPYLMLDRYYITHNSVIEAQVSQIYMTG